MEKKITLKELAIILDVSVSTVSKALNDSHEISKETKTKIQEIAAQYNYTPNLLARSLKTNKTKTIGVIIPNILAHFFAKVLLGIEHAVSAKGYNIITCMSDESYEKEMKSMQMLGCGMVDGFIVSIARETQIKKSYEHFDDAINQGLAVLLFDRVSEEIDCDKVVINDFESAYNATNHLIATGCKNILFVSPIARTSVGIERANGYKDALKNNSNHTQEGHFIEIDDYKEFAVKLIAALRERKIDAILAADELSGIYAMNTVISQGYSVPEDISVIGFTDGILSENSNPPLTTMSQHGIELGAAAAEKIMARLNPKNNTRFNTTVIKTSLIERGSTRAINCQNHR